MQASAIICRPALNSHPAAPPVAAANAVTKPRRQHCMWSALDPGPTVQPQPAAYLLSCTYLSERCSPSWGFAASLPPERPAASAAAAISLRRACRRPSAASRLMWQSPAAFPAPAAGSSGGPPAAAAAAPGTPASSSARWCTPPRSTSACGDMEMPKIWLVSPCKQAGRLAAQLNLIGPVWLLRVLPDVITHT